MRLGIIWLVAVYVLVVVSGGCKKLDGDQSVEPPPIEVTVGRPLVSPIVEWDEFTGRIAAIEEVEIRAKVGGYLQDVYFQEGQIVRKEDLLLVIDPRPFQAELRRAVAGLAEAEAKVAEERAMLIKVEATKRQTDAALQLKKQQRDRARSLVQQNAMSREDAEIRESEYLQAEADLAAADAGVEAAKAVITTATAAVETAASNVQTAKLNVSYTEVRSPIDGRIGRREITTGNLVSGGTTVSSLLATVVSIEPIHCYFDVNEQDYLKYLRLAQAGKRESSRDAKNPLYLALVDETGYPHLGHMDFVDNRIDPNTGTLRGRGIFPNADGALTPGLFARIRLPGSARYEAFMIPDNAIGVDQADKFVYVIDGQSKVARQNIKTGPMKNGLRIVREGLTGNETIVVSGLQRIFPGTVVKTKEQPIVATQSDGLPDDYKPVPKEKWLSNPANPAPPKLSTTEGSK